MADGAREDMDDLRISSSTGKSQSNEEPASIDYTKKKIVEDLIPLKELKANLSRAAEAIQTTKMEIGAQGVSVADAINTSFEELQKILENRKQELLTEASDKVQEKMDKLLAQEKMVSLANEEVQNVLDHTERFVNHSSDNEDISMHVEIRKKIEKEIEEHSKPGRSMEPVEKADIGVKVMCAEALQQLCQTNATITALVTEATTVKGEGLKTAEVRQVAEVILTMKSNSDSTSAEVAGKLKCLHNLSVIDCEVEQIGPGEHRIQYTPTFRGRHELSVLVNGQQVAGSPFPVFVSIQPTELGQPVHLCSEIQCPVGITINCEGDIIITEFQGDIVKIDKKGDKHVLVKHSKTLLHTLYSVATDNEGNIYCTDESTNRVMKCSKNGDNVQVYKLHQVKGPGHWGVTIAGDEVMLCERNNTGVIMIYDRELKYVRKIEYADMAEFRCMATDSHGNVYVTDSTSSRIRVFSKNGDLLRSFGFDSNGVKKLHKPYGVCLSGQYVYATNYRNHSVAVFTTAGDYVTSFGQFGDKKGDFRYPYHICVDNLVCVADSNNNRIQCF